MLSNIVRKAINIRDCNSAVVTSNIHNLNELLMHNRDLYSEDFNNDCDVVSIIFFVKSD